MAYFGPNYRQGDMLRQDSFVDSTDVTEIYKATAVGAFALLPIMSSPINWLLSNLVNANPVEVVRRRMILRALFTIMCLAINVSTVLMAIWVCQNAPTANQYVLGCAIFGAYFSATLGTNMLRALLNTFSVPYLTSAAARQLLKDCAVVSELKLTKIKIADETFTSVEGHFDVAASSADQSNQMCLKTQNVHKEARLSALCVEQPAFSDKKRRSIL